MSFKFFIITLMIGLYSLKRANAQVETNLVIERIIESIADRVGEDFDYAELTERLNSYQKHPININKTNSEQLAELIILTPVQINALLNHIKENGNILELVELQIIEGFDLETIRKLTPFISVYPYNALTDIANGSLKKGNHDVMLRFGQIIEPQYGYQISDTAKVNSYLGSPTRVLLRYRYNYGANLSASINMEKDAGEQFISGRQIRGFDFYSGNVFLKNAGRFTKVIVGDYSLQFGQGLSLWSGLGIGKGAEVASSAKQDMGLRPYTSTNEALFFRGLAATIKIRKLLYTPFISYSDFDASLAFSKVNTAEITSFGISGLHRTQTEIANKNSASQLVFGNTIQYDAQNLDIGITAYHTSFDHTFEKGKFLYNQFDFSSKSLTNFGLNYSYTNRNNYFFGEAAHSLNSGFAFVNGILTSLSPQVSTILLYRNYDKDYHSFYNQAFSEASTAVNEKGFYSGLVIKPVSQIELSGYFDIFSFPWMKFRVDAPSKGYEFLSQLVYTFGKKLKVSARYRIQLKEENDDVEQTVNTLEEVSRQNYRLELNYKVGDDFIIRNRAEISQYRKSNSSDERGYMIFQDLIYNPIQSKFSGNLRFAIFDTPGFDTRIYAYENDVLYSYSSPAYQNRGLRFYINGRYTVKKGVDIWAKYSITNYTNIDQIGSGLDMIQGNKRSEVKLQLRYQF